MIEIEKTPLPDVYIVTRKAFEDHRGQFARLFCRKTFEQCGLVSSFPQENLSTCRRAGTLRGLHYQTAPAEEVKLLHCIRGAVFDVLVDMRADSPTYLQWFGCELTATDLRSIYIPAGFAHGYQALVDESAVAYRASAEYAPEHEKCVRFDDPQIDINWPIASPILSDKDRNTPLLADQEPTT